RADHARDVARLDLHLVHSSREAAERPRYLHAYGHGTSCHSTSSGSSSKDCDASRNTHAVGTARAPFSTPTTTWKTPSEIPSAAMRRSVSDGRAGGSGRLGKMPAISSPRSRASGGWRVSHSGAT